MVVRRSKKFAIKNQRERKRQREKERGRERDFHSFKVESDLGR